MAFRLDKVTEYGQIEADDANPRRKRARIGARRIRRQNAQGQVVAYEATDTGGDLDVLCAALNVRASQANSDFRILSNDRSRVLLTKRVRLQQRIAGNWQNVAANPVNYRTVTKPNRGPDFAAWRWVYRLQNVARLEVEFAQELGNGKWEYEATNLSAASAEYRVVQRMDLVEAATARVPIYQRASIDAPPVLAGYRLDFAGQESISVNWSDMGADFGSVRADATFEAGSSIDIISAPFTLASGASKLIDPTYTSDAGWSAEAAAGDSAWATGTDFGGANAAGRYAGNELRQVFRFPISSVTAGATVDSVTLEWYVEFVADTTGGFLGRIGPHAGDGRTDPQTESPFSTSWANAENSGDYYVNGLTSIQTTGAKSQSLGSAACSDVASARSASVTNFAVSMNAHNMAGTSDCYSITSSYNNSTPSHQPNLVVVYTEASGSSGDGRGCAASGANAASVKGGIAAARAVGENQSFSTSAKQGRGASIAANGNAANSVSLKGAFGASSASQVNTANSASAKGSAGAGSDAFANLSVSVSRKGAFGISVGAGSNSDQADSVKGGISIALGHVAHSSQAGSTKGGRGSASSYAGNSGWAVSVAGAIGGGNGFAYNSNSGFATSLHGGRGAGQGESRGTSNSSSAKGVIGAGRGITGNQSVSVSQKGAFAAGRAVGSGSSFSSSTNTGGAVPNANGAGRGFGSSSGFAGSRKGGRGAGSAAISISCFASASPIRLPFLSNIAPQANIRMADVWWRKDYITEDSARHLFEIFKEKTH